jgi:uncharacterized protein YyaL (SSP411 family)
MITLTWCKRCCNWQLQAEKTNGCLKADELQSEQIRDFSREDGFFYYTSAMQADVPVRKVDVYDGATPSANAFMAYNLQLCGMCMDKNEWVCSRQKWCRT